MCTLSRSCSATHPRSIQEIIVKPFERQNDTTYYPIKIITYSNETIELRYTYSDFIQFSRALHKRYDVDDYQLHILKKQHSLLKRGSTKYFERQLELEDFCQRLLLLPEAIKTSDFFLSFFWPSTQQQQQQQQLQRQQQQEDQLRPASIRRMFSIKSNHSSLSSSRRQSYNSTTHTSSHEQQQMPLDTFISPIAAAPSTKLVSQTIGLTKLHSQNDLQFKQSTLSVPVMTALRTRHSFSHVIDTSYIDSSSSSSSSSSTSTRTSTTSHSFK